MKTSPWLQRPVNWVLGSDPHLRRHVLMVVLTLQAYAVSMGVLLHSSALGLLSPRMAHALVGAGALAFLAVYALVRSGLTQRLADPVLTFPHALASIALCMGAYTQLGPHRANVMILIAQTIVLAMFRLRPMQVLMLGLFTIVSLAGCVLVMSITDPVRNPAALGWTHFVVGGSTLLTLSLIGKWVSDIRVRIGRQARELQEAVDTVRQMATTDMLTGALNRRMMTELAEAELKLVERTGTPLCVALIDIDHFKRVNDVHGHHAGDAVLRSLSQHAQTQIRQVDKFSRWGGEEFLVMLPSITAADALNAMERLRQSVEVLTIPGHATLKVTFSAGIAQWLPGETLEHFVERADQALYEAKRHGRNRCVTAGSATAATTAGPAASEVHP